MAATSPPWNVDEATRFGARGSSSATRPSTVTMSLAPCERPCSPICSMTARPSGLYGRTATASATGTGVAFSISTTMSSSAPSAAAERIA